MPTALKDFPCVRFHAEAHLVTWNPIGVFDDDLADLVVEFMECEERVADEPFHRFIDLSGLTEIRLRFGHTFQIAERRRAAFTGSEGVKSAFYCDWIFGMGIARTYEALMAGAPLKVRAFSNRANAAAWLGVPIGLLLPISTPKVDLPS